MRGEKTKLYNTTLNTDRGATAAGGTGRLLLSFYLLPLRPEMTRAYTGVLPTPSLVAKR